MTTPWRKVLRDFRQERARTILVVLAIAAGIAAFTAVLASYAILTRELNTAYLATNPASATIRTDAVDDALLAAVGRTKGVAVVEARRSLTGRIKGARGWRNLTLFVVQDFGRIRVSKLNPERGAWPPAWGEILIERDAMQVGRLHIGDRVVVRTLDGSERLLRVAGTVHDVGQAQARMENLVYGYINADTLAQLGEEPVLNQLKVLVDGDRFDERHIQDVVADVKKVVEERGHPVLRVDVPEPGKHPHADIMGMLMLSLASFGLFVMLLSGVIVVNLLAALMAAQVRQIGMMKAIGGTRGQIARIYFSQALLLGLAAIALALPAGVLGSRALCRAQAVFLNFDIASFAIPLWVWLLVIAAGIVTPLLAAAVPVWRGSGVSVREALADFGVASNRFGATRFDRLLAGLGGITRPLLLAIRNNFRRRARLALTVLTLAAGGLFFMTALNLRASMINTLDRLFDTRKYDLSVGIVGMAQQDDALRVARGVPGVRKAEAWIASEGGSGVRQHAAALKAVASHRTPEGFTILALPAETELLKPVITEGRWLAPGESDAIVVNSALAAKNKEMRVGNRVTFPMGPGVGTFRVAGIAREPFSPAVAYIPRAFFDSRPGHEGITNNLRLALDPSAPMDRVKAQLEDGLARAGIRSSSMTSRSESRFGFDQHMVMIYVALIVMSALIGGVGALGLATTMSINVLERRREIAVLRAVGATPRTVWLMLIAEGAVVGFFGWILAAVLAVPLSRGVGNLLMKTMFRGLDSVFELRGLLVWLAVSLLLGAVASFLPARHATRQPVREALGYE